MIVSIEHISKTFFTKEHQIKAIDDLSLEVKEGQSLAIVGESGSGKSTLAKLIVGLEKPDTGKVRVDRSLVQMVFQDPYSSFDPMWTIQGSFHESFRRAKISKVVQVQRMESMLKEVGLDASVLSRYPHEFSGGQRQRLAIARCLLADPKLLILDEATSALDTLVARQILDLLKEIKYKFNLTYIFISHNLRVVKSFSDIIIVMRHGQVVEAGSVSKVFNSPAHPYTQQLIKSAFEYA